MKSNKKIGNETEKAFAKAFHAKGWWVHIFADKVSGQPFDIVAAKNNYVFFLDVKHVKDKPYLLHSRIEENQINAFEMLRRRGTTKIGFVVYFEDIDEWKYLPYGYIDWTKSRTHRDEMQEINMKKR